MRVMIFCLVLVGTFLSAQRISIQEHEVWWPDGLWNAVWCSVTVEDLFGVYVRGLKVEDFQVVEKAYDGKGNLLAEKPVSFVESSSYKFNGKGFWEKTVNSDVDRLVEKGTGFRIFIGMHEAEGEPEWPISIYQSRFFDVTMLEEIRSAIDEINTWGEWWNLTWGYDVFLWSLKLNWREDARKVVVVITDVYTDSVYGPNWYFSSGCVTSMRAVDLALREKGMELYYCQPKEEEMAKTELQECFSPKVNLKVKESNFDALEKINGRVKRLSWPFDQSEIELSDSPIVDSKYYFAWVSRWGDQRSVDKVEVVVSLKYTNSSASFVFYPLVDPDGRKTDERVNVTLTLVDETGAGMVGKGNVWIDFYRVMGETERRGIVGAMFQKSDENGKVALGNVFPGKYYYVIRANGSPSYAYYRLRYAGEGWLEVTRKGATPEKLKVETSDKDAEIYRMRGLLEEVESLKIATGELRDLSARGKAWLENLKEEGVTPLEMEAIKRFNVAVGALLNCAGYADLITVRVAEDVESVAEKAMEMVRKAREVVNKLVSAKHVFSSIVNKFIDIITMNWSGAATGVTIEVLIDRLAKYVRDDMVDDVMETVERKLMETLGNPERVVDYFRSHVKRWVVEQLTPERLGEHALSFVKDEIVMERFTLTFTRELNEILTASERFVEENSGRYWYFYDRSMKAKKDFEEMRKALMTDLFEVSYEALKDQSSLDEWAKALSVLRESVSLVVDFVELFEVRYPELSEIKEALKTLFDALDMIGTLTKTYEAALKLNHLNELARRVVTVRDRIF